MIADPALMFQASAAIFLKRLGEHLDGGVPEMDLNPVAIELDLVNPAFANGDLVD